MSQSQVARLIPAALDVHHLAGTVLFAASRMPADQDRISSEPHKGIHNHAVNPSRYHAITLLALTLSLSACHQCQTASLEEKDRLANSATSKTWLAAAQARDWRTVALLYTEDAILMPPNGPPVVGRENIRAWFADFPPLSRFHTETLEVVGCGDLSYLRAGTS